MKRVGHAGTLDPMATGVLLLCLGQATRLTEYLMANRKTYRAEISFGAVTDTQDATGRVQRTYNASSFAQKDLEALIPQFTGDLMQTPPMVSAVHHEGKRLYELARQGIEVEREARPVTVYGIRLIQFTPGTAPKAEVEITCSSGTYVRTLAHDLGQTAGVGAHLSALRRTAVGDFQVQNALSLEEAVERARTGTLTDRMEPMKKALEGYPLVSIAENQLDDLRHGKALPLPPGLNKNEAVIGLLGAHGDLIALARTDMEQIRPFKVLLD